MRSEVSLEIQFIMTIMMWRLVGWEGLIGASVVNLLVIMWHLYDCKLHYWYILYHLASSDLLSKTRIVLVCEGLDTVARVFINGNLVGQSVNMFVRYIFNIKDALTVSIID